jgi:hypothetical protein
MISLAYSSGITLINELKNSFHGEVRQIKFMEELTIKKKQQRLLFSLGSFCQKYYFLC